MDRNLPWYLDLEAFSVAFLLLFSVAWGTARADYTPISTYSVSGVPGGPWSDPSAACNAFFGNAVSISSGFYSGHALDSAAGGNCSGYLVVTSDGSHAAASGSYSTSTLCSSGGTLTGGVCVNGCGTAGTTASDGLHNFGTNSGGAALVCNGGCLMLFGGVMSDRALVGGVYNYFGTGTMTRTGESCTSTTVISVPVASVPDATCASGQTMGSINGKDQCFTVATGDPVNPNTGQSGGADVTVVVVGPGGVGTTATTTAPDGVVTVVTKDAAGIEVSRQVTGADPLDEFCSENPSASICSKSWFSGSCGAFVCDGDAAACAAARAASEMNCKLSNDAASTQSALLTATGTGTAEASFNSAKTSSSLSSALSFNDRTIAAASCPAAYSVAALGTTISFSWQVFCDLAEVIGVFVMLGATVLSGRIVLGGL